MPKRFYLALFIFVFVLHFNFGQSSYFTELEERWNEMYTEIQQSGQKQVLLLNLININESEANVFILGKLYKELGLYYYGRADYQNALLYYQNGISSFEKINYKSGEASIYNLLVTLSKKQKDYKRALEYSDLNLDLCIKIKDSICISTVHDNRGLIYAENGDFKTAKLYYLKALEIRELIQDTIGLGYVYSNLAEVYVNEGNFKKAELFIEKSNVLKNVNNDLFGIAVNFTNLAEMLFSKKNYIAAVTNFEKSLSISERLNEVDLTQWNYKFLSECYQKIGDSEKALDYLNKSYALKESMFSKEKIQQITEMETKFDTERKEQKIEIQALELETQKQKLKNQILLFVSILTLLILGVLGYYYYLKNKQKLQLKNTELQFQQKMLNATIEAQEKERTRISRELHDGIGQQLSGLKMGFGQLSASLQESAIKEKISQLTTILDETTNEVRSISHEMMPKSLQEFGIVPAIEDMTNKTFKHLDIACTFEFHNIVNRYTNEIELSVYRICQELINNSIKHANAKHIDIQLMQNKNYLILIVADDGNGFSDTTINISGNGMLNMQSRAKSVRGDIAILSSPDGTTATLKIPIDTK